MQTTLAVREKASQLLAADSATLAPAALANVIALVKAAFLPSEILTIGALTLADFDGASPLACGVGSQAEGLDGNTNDSIITLKSPVGGWRWETTGVTNLPQQIFGHVLLDSTLATVLASESLPTPITLNAANQVHQLGALNIRQLANSMT